MMKKKIRVLQILHDFKKGGVQAEVMWPARLLDKEDVEFDVLLFTDVQGYYEEEFKQYGNIYRIVPPRAATKPGTVLRLFTNYFFVKKKMLEFLKTTPHYDAVHSHHLLYNAPCLSAAKANNIPVRIAHSAVNKPTRRDFHDRLYIRVYYKLSALLLNGCATNRYGVTQNAADYIFGKNKGRMIKNPTLALSRFDPTAYTRENPETLSLLMVGSYGKRKNQRFALEILKCLADANIPARLTYIGYPRSEKDSYLPNLKRYAEEAGLNDRVRFLPQDADIPYEFSQSDYLLIPSLQEGLPNVALEAQAMWTPCVVSTDVSNDCDSGLCKFLPLSEGAQYWADFIYADFQATKGKKHFVDMSEWDNRKVVREYLEIWRGNKK